MTDPELSAGARINPQLRTGDVIEGPPVVGKYMVYAGSRDGFLYAVGD